VEACVEYLAPRALLLLVGLALLAIVLAPPWALSAIVARIFGLLPERKRAAIAERDGEAADPSEA
jgi:hypothetical protein